MGLFLISIFLFFLFYSPITFKQTRLYRVYRSTPRSTEGDPPGRQYIEGIRSLFIWPTPSTEMGSTHLRDHSRRRTFSALVRDVMSPKQQAALICTVVQKNQKPEIPGPLFAYGLSGMFTILTSRASLIR